MWGNMMKVYCDEAGFTGNNLLDDQQQSFVYSSVAIEPAQAEDLVQKTVQDFRLQGDEVKGSRLIKYERGRQAIRFLLSECVNNTKIIFADKPFTLACKFHEYIFEPVYAQGSLVFYEAGFHKFVANVLYDEWKRNNSVARVVLREFQELMRTKDPHAVQTLFSGALDDQNVSSSIRNILLFVFFNKDVILKEIRLLEGLDIGTWILEVTHTSLFALLGFWSKKYGQLEVYCDHSKPLLAQREVLDNLVGRDVTELKIFSNTEPLVFPSLSMPLQLVDSRTNPGIQIADALAAGFSYAVNKITEPEGEKLYQEFEPVIQPSLFPEKEYIDGTAEEAFINSLVLLELVDRCARGEGLIEGMDDYIYTRRLIYPEYREQITTNFNL
jgi:hypothetical protein